MNEALQRSLRLLAAVLGRDLDKICSSLIKTFQECHCCNLSSDIDVLDVNVSVALEFKL